MDADFEEFVRSAQRPLLLFGQALTGNPHDAADLTQSALERVGLRWRRVRKVEHPLAYTKRVMARLHVSSWRRHRHESVQQPRESTYSDAPPFIEQSMWTALITLPPRQRAVLVLRYYEDLSEDQIADALGCRRGTVKSQASRGLDTLRKHWIAAQPTEVDR